MIASKGIVTKPTSNAQSIFYVAASTLDGVLLGSVGTEFVEQGGPRRFKATFLLQAFLVACNLRRDSRLRETTINAIKLMFPPGLVDQIVNALE